jgi:arylsulfatase
VFEERLPAGERHLAAHAVPLSAASAAPRRARLVFAVDGAPARALFLDPVVGPAEIGSYAARPWKAHAPDVVVFLADTFRADNLRAYGGTLGLTPHLDRLAAEGLVFRRAWSTGTFTLPAHATMFAGVHPYQAGIVGHARGLPHAWTTLAEELTRAGYRTGAVTESVFVSQAYGMDQGFARWDEDRRPLETTLERARAFLDADDGRPAFLFVQTYRTHAPYVVSDETRREHGARLELAGGWEDVQQELARIGEAPDAPDVDERTQGVAAAARALYRGTAADLDRGFATFRADLAARGLERSGYLIFTSDHGEAFLEHGELFHPGPVWDELVRVPFVVAGRDVEPGVAASPASLLDLAPTVCRLAGVEPRPEWLGRALVGGGRELAGEPSILMFECQPREGATLGVVEGWRKTIGFEDAAALGARGVLGAFDLAVDPRERNDLAHQGWARAALERNGAALERALVPAVGLEDATLDAGKAAELRAMGYTGD